MFDLNWNGIEGPGKITYGDVFLENERQYSTFNFDKADIDLLLQHFADAEKSCQQLLGHRLPLPAYDYCIKASHLFNLLDARGAISVTERASYIGRVRALAKGCFTLWNEFEAEHE